MKAAPHIFSSVKAPAALSQFLPRNEIRAAESEAREDRNLCIRVGKMSRKALELIEHVSK